MSERFPDIFEELVYRWEPFKYLETKGKCKVCGKSTHVFCESQGDYICSPKCADETWKD
jgi:hypothetical protein